MSDNIKLTKEYCKNGFLPTDLQWPVEEIADDFTLYDLFRLVHYADMMIPGIPATLGMLEFNAFWAQINHPRDPDDKDDITHLELYWHMGYDTRKEKKIGKPTDQPDSKCAIMNNGHNYWDNPKIGEMPNLMSFHGIGPGCPSKNLDFHECGDDCPAETGCAIEFTPINNLAHLPIRVRPEVEFYPPFVESDREFKRTGFKLTIKPTLGCLITSIFWELTFAGPNPDTVAQKTAEIMDSVEEAKQHFKENFDEESDNNNIAN